MTNNLLNQNFDNFDDDIFGAKSLDRVARGMDAGNHRPGGRNIQGALNNTIGSRSSSENSLNRNINNSYRDHRNNYSSSDDMNIIDDQYTPSSSGVVKHNTLDNINQGSEPALTVTDTGDNGDGFNPYNSSDLESVMSYEEGLSVSQSFSEWKSNVECIQTQGLMRTRDSE